MDAPEPSTPGSSLTPEQFLQLVDEAEPGWSSYLGGPGGVAGICAEMQAELKRQSELIAAVRIAAIQELLITHSGSAVAARLGVTKQAIWQASRRPAWKDPRW